MSRTPNAVEPGPADRGDAEAIVRFEDVGMRYGRAPEVLKDISFELAPGSFHFLMGASGAGKSSLLKLIYLATRPSRGLITLFGQDVATIPRRDLPILRRRIGVVFQEYRLLDHVSAFDNVALPLRIARIKPAAYSSDVAELLTWVGLGRKFNALPPTLAAKPISAPKLTSAAPDAKALLLAPSIEEARPLSPASPFALPQSAAPAR